MSKKRFKLDTYQTVYNIDLVVCYGDMSTKELQALYRKLNDSELDDDFNSSRAWCSALIRKSDGATILFVKINKDFNDGFTSSGDELLDMINCASHEAAHCALYLFSIVGANSEDNNSEPFAYLLGYFTERIMKTLLNK